MTQTIHDTGVREVVETNDQTTEDDGKRHVIAWQDNLHIYKKGMTSQDIVDFARVNGVEVVALCGKIWIPSQQVAGRETCDPCVDLMQAYLNKN